MENFISIRNNQPQFNLNIEFDVQSGVTCIIGHSGAGKSTLLRFIAGLEQNNNNIIALKSIWQNKKKITATHKRDIAFAFQSDNLFTHLSVAKNIDLITSEKPEYYQGLKSILIIEPLLEKMPSELSGGEKQRIALFKALIIKSDIILLDEPLSAVDTHHKKIILHELQNLKAKINTPILYVSHNYDEIIQIADQIICLEHGQKIFDLPFSSNIINQYFQKTEPNNIASVFDMALQPNTDSEDLDTLFNDDFSIRTTKTKDTHSQFRVKIYAKDVSICTEKPVNTSIINILEAVIVEFTHLDNSTLISAEINNKVIYSLISLHSFKQLQLSLQKKIWLQIKAVSLS